MRSKLLVLAVSALTILGAEAIIAASASALTGAGSTLVAPLMVNWITSFEVKEEIPVEYSPVGSGAGILQVTAGSVDFGASDAPLTTEQAAACGGCVEIPWGLTAVGVGFDIPGVKKLKLTGPILAQIYFGKITNWDDPKIRALNEGVRLPDLPITPLHRSIGSGDTYVFTNYLSKISAAWKREVGYGITVGFPGGLEVKSNDGMLGTLTHTAGAVGYLPAAYLIAADEPAAAVENEAGRFELPNLQNIESAAGYVEHLPVSNAVSITDPPKKQEIAYPISTFTYAIIPRDAPQSQALRKFAQYCVTQGQRYGPPLDFAPLPKVVTRAARKAIASL